MRRLTPENLRLLSGSHGRKRRTDILELGVGRWELELELELGKRY